jgi:2Fe-2S ferredoxin
MVTVTYYDADGVRYARRANVGDSMMEAAVTTGVPGIDAICGGSCVCGTCHVYVDEAWLARLKPPLPAEDDLLEVSANRRSNSRLGCQIRLSDDLDGVVVRIPAAQG